jgi:hypothetical protein
MSSVVHPEDAGNPNSATKNATSPTSPNRRKSWTHGFVNLSDELDDVAFRWADRVSYHLDKWVEGGGTQALLMIGCFTVLVTITGFLQWLSPEHASGDGYGDCVWEAWTYMADPGTHADATSLKARAIGGVISALGIFFFATVLGFVVDNVRGLMDSLKQGKSLVVESDHILILGWTDRCPALLKEIALACESEGGGTVVVLAEGEKSDLETTMHHCLTKEDLKGLDVVFRNGSALILNDLQLVSAQTARAIIVLACTTGEADVADSNVLRTVLQLKALRGGINGHIVAEMRDVDNEALVQMVGAGSVETVVSHDIIGRLMLMAARQPGLATVYESILGFEGEEFYLKQWPVLEGIKFKDLQTRFPDAIPLGIKRAGYTGTILYSLIAVHL